MFSDTIDDESDSDTDEEEVVDEQSSLEDIGSKADGMNYYLEQIYKDPPEANCTLD